MLNAPQGSEHFIIVIQSFYQQANVAIQLIGGTHGFYALGVFGNTIAIGQAGSAVVTGAGVNLGKAIAHEELLFGEKLAG